MKISKVIIVCNDNPHYYQFANDIYDIWEKYIKIPPHLFIITDDREKLKIDFGDRKVQIIKPIKDIPTPFQSQVIRLLIPCLFEDEYTLITDIDMIPLNKKFFKKFPKYLNDDIFIRFFHNYQMCYNCAKGTIWKKIFKIDSIAQIKKQIIEWYNTYNGSRTTDQIVLKQYLDSYLGPKIILTSYIPSNSNINRLSTYQGIKVLHNFPFKDVKEYIDFHVHHGFHTKENIESYKKIVDYLLHRN